MNQQVEKQAESLWRFPERGQTEYGNAECKETQRKIGNGMRMRTIPEELKSGRSKVISMSNGKREGRRKSKTLKYLKVWCPLFFLVESWQKLVWIKNKLWRWIYFYQKSRLC